MHNTRTYMALALIVCAPMVAFAGSPEEDYESARAALQKVKGDPAKRKLRTNWSKLATRLVELADAHKGSAVAPRALFTAGELFRELRKVTLSPHDLEDSLTHYGRVAAEYPQSPLADDALYYRVLLLQEVKNDRPAACEALGALLGKYADGDMAAKARKLAEGCPPPGIKPAAAMPAKEAAKAPEKIDGEAPRTAGRVTVGTIDSHVEKKGALITVNLSGPAKFYYEELKAEPKKGTPARLYLDIHDATLPPDAPKSIPVEKGFIKQVRAGQNKSDLVRIVLDLESIERYSIMAHERPDRIVMKFGEVKHEPAPVAAAKSPAPGPQEKPAPPPKEVKAAAKEAAKDPAPAPAPEKSAASPAPAPPPMPPPVTAAAPATQPAAAKEGAKEAAAPVPGKEIAAPPDDDAKAPPMIVAMKEGLKAKIKNGTADTGIPLSEQLGLKFRRIVIDPGHGGEDSGAIGKKKTNEKDVALAIAKKLAAKLKDRLRLEVVMTRTDDRTVPLSERTALARAVKADLFISIHANANPNRTFRGIETYYLNNTDDRAAQKVAAMENAVSEKALSDLKMTLLDLALSANVEDSIRLANLIQKNTVATVAAKFSDVKDHGVKYALFYVLFGTEVPSVLVETSFISNPIEEQRLRTTKYQEQVAEGIYRGIEKYVGDRKAKSKAP